MDPDFILTLEREEMDLVLKLKKKEKDFVTVRLCFSKNEEFFLEDLK